MQLGEILSKIVETEENAKCYVMDTEEYVKKILKVNPKKQMQ